MKNRFFKPALATMGLLAAIGTAAHAANTVVIDRIDQPAFNNDTSGDIYGGEPVYFHTADGGEFTNIVTDPAILALYASSTKVADPDIAGSPVGFETFCLELGTGFVGQSLPTNPLNYTITTNILNGGLTIVATPNQAAGTPEVVSEGTAWLYSQFANGTLTGYNYTDVAITGPGDTTTGRGDSAAALQAAIWYLEGQVSLANAGGTGVGGNPFLNLLTAPTGSGGLGLASINTAFTADPGGFNVDVFNVGDPSTPGVFGDQAQLVLVSPGTSVPDGGTTVMLLGIAFGGLALLKRKIAA